MMGGEKQGKRSSSKGWMAWQETYVRQVADCLMLFWDLLYPVQLPSRSATGGYRC